jgi:hypothetical protein
MNRVFAVIASVGVFVLLFAGAGTATGSKTKPLAPHTLVATYGKIYAFAQDGAAIGWIDGGARIQVRSLTSNGAETFGWVNDQYRAAGATLALAGTRALWAWDDGGNDYGTALMTGAPDREPIGAGELQGGYRGFGDGERFTGLAGDGKTLAFGWVNEACVDAPYGDCDICNQLGSCPLSVTGGGVTLVTSAATSQKRVIPNIAPPAFVAVSGVRVATAPARSPSPEGELHLRTAENGPVVVSTRGGTVLARVTPIGSVEGIALSWPNLAVLVRRADATKAIALHHAGTGALRSATVVPAAASDLALGSGIVFRVGRSIFTIRAGHPALLWRAKVTPIGLSVEGRRVAWAVNIKGRGRVVALTLPR